MRAIALSRFSLDSPEIHATNWRADGSPPWTYTCARIENERERERGNIGMEQLICIIHNLRVGAESRGWRDNEGSGGAGCSRIRTLGLLAGFVNATDSTRRAALNGMTNGHSGVPRSAAPRTYPNPEKI